MGGGEVCSVVHYKHLVQVFERNGLSDIKYGWMDGRTDGRTVGR